MMKKIGCVLLLGLIVAMGLSAEPKWKRLGYSSQQDFQRNYQQDLAKKQRERDAKRAQIQALKDKRAKAETQGEKAELNAQIERAEAQLQVIINVIAIYNSGD